MGIGDKLRNLIQMDDEEILEIEEDVIEDEIMISDYEEASSKGVARLSTDTKMVLFEPRSFGEAEEVAKRLKENRACVVNLHKLQRDYRQRTIDFLTGVIFALDGSIQKIGQNVILCAPQNIGVQGAIDVDGAEE